VRRQRRSLWQGQGSTAEIDTTAKKKYSTRPRPRQDVRAVIPGCTASSSVSLHSFPPVAIASGQPGFPAPWLVFLSPAVIGRRRADWRITARVWGNQQACWRRAAPMTSLCMNILR
jgi:hypothetical protein